MKENKGGYVKLLFLFAIMLLDIFVFLNVQANTTIDYSSMENNNGAKTDNVSLEKNLSDIERFIIGDNGGPVVRQETSNIKKRSVDVPAKLLKERSQLINKKSVRNMIPSINIAVSFYDEYLGEMINTTFPASDVELIRASNKTYEECKKGWRSKAYAMILKASDDNPKKVKLLALLGKNDPHALDLASIEIQ